MCVCMYVYIYRVEPKFLCCFCGRPGMATTPCTAPNAYMHIYIYIYYIYIHVYIYICIYIYYAYVYACIYICIYQVKPVEQKRRTVPVVPLFL